MKIKAFMIMMAVCTSFNIAAALDDNCCGIDRACTTEQEWKDGYHAHQNNQCQAPAPQVSTAAQTQNVDNCCFIGWQCNSNEDWNRGYQAYQNNQCGNNTTTSPSAIRLPIIEGSGSFVQRTREALEFLRVKSPVWFNYVVSKVRKIMENPNVPHARAHVREGSVSINDLAVRKVERYYPLSSILVHEACHIHQWESGKYDALTWNLLANSDLERECYAIQAQVLSEVLPGHRGIGLLRCLAKHHPFRFACS